MELIWQSRASRVRSERPYGITLAYYHACAARAALNAYRPRRGVPTHDMLADPDDSGVMAPLSPDPACDALLASMGIHERQKLGAVSYTLIASGEQELEARVRALARPDADLEDLCALACALEAGASDADELLVEQVREALRMR